MRFVSLVLTVLICAGCTLFLIPPDVQVKDVSIVGIDSKGVDIELYLAVTNPNPYGLKLAGYSYDLKVMAFPLAKGGGRDAFDFKGGGSVTELRFPVRVALRSLYEIIKRGPDIDRVPYQLDAGLELETPVGSKTVPINHNGVFSVPERYRPQFYLKQFKNILGGTAQ